MPELLYISAARLPTEKAHGLQIMKTCEGFAREDFEVEAWLPSRHQPLKADPFAYYAVPRTFKLRLLPALDLMWLVRGWGFLLLQVSFAKAVFIFLLFTKKKPDRIVYGRDRLPLLAASFFSHPVFFELHDFTPRLEKFLRRWHKRFAGFVVTNTWKKEQLMLKIGIEAVHIHVAPNGVDLEGFETAFDRAAFRQARGWRAEEVIVMYVGKFYAWKGVQHLMSAATSLAPSFRIVCVGGSREEAKKLLGAELDARVECISHVAHADVPSYLRAADVLVLPNSASTEESRFATSPIKCFEYMASGTPIVASDLPSIREILDDHTASFAPPDDVHALAEVIHGVALHMEESRQKAKHARERVQSFTWQKRTQGIATWMSGRLVS